LSILLVCFPLAIIISSIFPGNDFLAANIWTPFFFVANSLYILLTVSFTSFIHLFAEWYRKERANKELERINTQNELKYLKSQINPHFLFNSLNNLYAMTLSNSPDAPDMVLRLSSILRYLLYETSETKVPLDKEINYLKDLLELEKIRVGDRADISFEIIGDTSAVEIEPLLFINFVENSFKHGVNSVTDSAWMKMVLKVDKEKNTLDFTIENSKPVENLGNKNDSIGGIGLVNVKKRLKLLYPNKHKLSLLNDNEKYSVNLLLHIG
jgi:two-component system LytT family sensor kinase